MSTSDVQNKSAPEINGDALSGAVSKLLEHPELISMVASALGGAGVGETGAKATPSSAPAASTQNEPAPAAMPSISPDAIATLMPMLGKLSSIGSESTEFKHEPLLCALKPYLNKQRCETVDYIIRLSKLSSIIGKMR